MSKLKTKDVAKQLNVSPSTVIKWAKKHDVPFTLNANGHYRFEEQHVRLFQEIKEQNRTQSTQSRPTENNSVSSRVIVERLEDMEEKMKLLETMISNKADDIVSFQLMEHRKDVRKLNARLERVEEKVKQLTDEKEKRVKRDTYSEPRKEKRFLASLFSL